MLIQLRDESGETLFAHDDMEGAVDYCLEHPDYGITWFPEGGEGDCQFTNVAGVMECDNTLPAQRSSASPSSRASDY